MHIVDGPSRRGFLKGLSACTASMALSSRSQAIAPLAALAAASAIVSIVTDVLGVLSDNRKEALLRDISDKLNAVIRNQEAILAEIQGLKLYIDEALNRSFRENTIIRLNAHMDRYEVLIAEKPGAGNREQYLELQAQVSQTTFELGQYDTPAYIAFGAGVAMTLAIHRALSRRGCPPSRRYSSARTITGSTRAIPRGSRQSPSGPSPRSIRGRPRLRPDRGRSRSTRPRDVAPTRPRSPYHAT